MNNSNDLECPTTIQELATFGYSPGFREAFMTVIEKGIFDKELYINELQEV